jgi:acyl-CoA hydrolase
MQRNHSETFADGVLHLIKKGVINGSNKAIDKGKVVASFILGSREVFDFVDHNPGVMMMDVGYTNDPYIISRNPKVASVNTSTQIDLTGQVCADSIGSRILSGTGGQLEFVRGAFLSKGGVSIIAITSRTKNGESKIVPALNLASGVVTPRADIQWGVTEYGAVNLLGKSLQEGQNY